MRRQPYRRPARTSGRSESVLECRNRDQRTAREPLMVLWHYRHPPPAQEQHSVFTRRVRGQRVRTKRTYRVEDRYRQIQQPACEEQG